MFSKQDNVFHSICNFHTCRWLNNDPLLTLLFLILFKQKKAVTEVSCLVSKHMMTIQCSTNRRHLPYTGLLIKFSQHLQVIMTTQTVFK